MRSAHFPHILLLEASVSSLSGWMFVRPASQWIESDASKNARSAFFHTIILPKASAAGASTRGGPEIRSHKSIEA